jgi:hypothetical protein
MASYNASCPPFKELQWRLNNVMRNIMKKEILKLLHARIIYLSCSNLVASKVGVFNLIGC